MVDADLSDYFTSIPHGDLLRCVARRIADGTVLAVIAQYLLMRSGEVMAQHGTLPAWLALQLPTVVLSVVALALIAVQARRGPGAVR